jgi:hypothetical protein
MGVQMSTAVANPRRTQVTNTFVVGARVTANVARVTSDSEGRVSATADASCGACGYSARGYGFGVDAKGQSELECAHKVIDHMERYHRALAVGSGVTQQFPQDALGYVVVAVSKNGKVATLASMSTDKDALGGEPYGFTGPFPIWAKTYDQDELDARVAEFAADPESARYVTRVSLRKDGKWRPVGANYVGSEFSTKNAHYYRDYSW